MKVFITGGSGFVGRYLIPRLIEGGHEVRALARSSTSLAQVEALGASGAKGDLTDLDSLCRALRGCEVVIHSGAAFELWGDDDFFYNTNVRGTENLLRAAQECKIQRLIYISAASVVADGHPVRGVDETYQPRRSPLGVYSKTKLIAEQKVLAANSEKLTTLVLRPPFIWGHGHSKIAAIRQAVARGQWMWIGGGTHGLSTVHVENLCAAVLASLCRGSGGEVYFITDGETRSVRQFLTAWMRAEGIELGNRSIPRWMAAVSAALMAGIWRMLKLRSTPPLTPSLIAMMGTELSLRDQKAREHLGYRNVLTVDEGLEAL